MEFSTLFDLNSIPSLDLSTRANRLPSTSILSGLQEMLSSYTNSGRAALTGLALLWHDHWDDAHRLVQEFEGNSDCDLVHGILHRREGDLSNARFWCRQVPSHPTFTSIALSLEDHRDRLPAIATLLATGKWSPLAFLQAVVKNPRNPDLQEIQALELVAIARLWWPATP